MISPLDELNTHFKKQLNKKTEPIKTTEKFEQKKKMSNMGVVLALVFCCFSILYLVYMFIFQMECIIYNGQKSDGKINWGTVVSTVLLFMFCGPCMFLYRLFNRCTNKDMRNNVRNNVRNNTLRNNTLRNNTLRNNTPINNAPRNNAPRNNAPRNNTY